MAVAGDLHPTSLLQAKASPYEMVSMKLYLLQYLL